MLTVTVRVVGVIVMSLVRLVMMVSVRFGSIFTISASSVASSGIVVMMMLAMMFLSFIVTIVVMIIGTAIDGSSYWNTK